jgi:CMP-N-acetylneuraminic acid synthetase
MFKNLSFLGIIPARKNSKRLKNKNLKNLVKKPLIYYTIESARKSKYLDRFIISSDSTQIHKIAGRYKCEIPFIRPKYLSTNSACSADVICHALKKIKTNYDYVILLQPTSPLRLAKDIDMAINKIVNSKAVSLISVCYSDKLKKFPTKIVNNLIKKTKKDIKKKNYFLNGAIYICKTKFFLKKRTFYSNKTLAFFMPKNRSVDVDTLEDLNEVKKILN